MGYGATTYSNLFAEKPRGTCPHCGRPIPRGGTVTCTRSECQETNFVENRQRNARKRR